MVASNDDGDSIEWIDTMLCVPGIVHNGDGISVHHSPKLKLKISVNSFELEEKLWNGKTDYFQSVGNDEGYFGVSAAEQRTPASRKVE